MTNIRFLNINTLKHFLCEVCGDDYNFDACLNDLFNQIAARGDKDRGIYEVSRFEAVDHKTHNLYFKIKRDIGGTIIKIIF